MKQVFASLAVAISLFAVAPFASAQSDFVSPVDTRGMQLIGKLGPSFYWIALEENSPGKKTEKVVPSPTLLFTSILPLLPFVIIS